MQWDKDTIYRDLLYSQARKDLGVITSGGISTIELDAFCMKMSHIFELLTGQACSPGAVENQIAWALSKQKDASLHRSHVKVKTLNKEAAKKAGFILE